MAAVCEITAAEFLQASQRQKLFFPRFSSRQMNRLLWGTLRRQSPGKIYRAGLLVQVRVVVSRDASSSVSELPAKVKRDATKVLHLYRIPFIQESATAELLKLVQTKVSNQIIGLKTEQCFNVGVDGDLSDEKLLVFKWLLGETYEPDNLGVESFLDKDMKESLNTIVVEVGPRLSGG